MSSNRTVQIENGAGFTGDNTFARRLVEQVG